MKRNAPDTSDKKRTTAAASSTANKRRSSSGGPPAAAAAAKSSSEGGTSGSSDNADPSAGGPSNTTSSSGPSSESNNRNQPQHSSSSAAGGAPPARSQEPSFSVTYPNPKSFAERLMKVLESRAVPDTIWWEDNGKIVALHVDKLKNGTVLADHFNNIKYKFFIRYFSRWGFRRITDFSVPYGLFYYRNSMFQRDRPHLVKHMRMDSNVQNVFADHEHQAHNVSSLSNEGTSPVDEADQPVVMEEAQDESGDRHNSSSNFQPNHSSDAQQQPQHPQIDPALLQNMLRFVNPQAQPQSDPPNYRQGQNDNPGTSFPPSQHQQQQYQPAQNASEDGVFSELLSQLVRQVRSSSQPHGQEMNRISRQLLLQQILRLSREYLEQTEAAAAARDFSPTSPQETSLRSILMVLLNMGQPVLLNHLQQQPPQQLPPRDPVPRLGALANPVGASSSSGSGEGASSLFPLLMQLSSGRQGQGGGGTDHHHHHQAGEASSSRVGQQGQGQYGGGGSGVQQQPQNPPPQHQHHHQHQPPNAGAADGGSQQQALQQILQGMLGGGGGGTGGLQQQQQNPSRIPPPQQHHPPPNAGAADDSQQQALQQILAALQQQQRQPQQGD